MIKLKEKPCKGIGRPPIKYSEKYIISKSFGSLKPIKEVERKLIGKSSPRLLRYFLCKCLCNNVLEVYLGHLLSGKTKSCGCSKLQASHFVTHGLSNDKIYNVWTSMKQRCYNSNMKRYKDWGGRGIIVCDEWKNDFKTFYDWSINNGYKYGLQLDRINNNGNYTPLNCRYVTPKVNSQNRRQKIK